MSNNDEVKRILDDAVHYYQTDSGAAQAEVWQCL